MSDRIADVSWAPVPNYVEVLPGSPGEDVPVTAAHVIVHSPAGILLTNVRSRGWDICGGHLEEDETALESAKRETLEESGIILDTLMPLGYVQLTVEASMPEGYRYPYPVAAQQVFVAYLDTALPPGPVEELECDEAEWVPFEEAILRCENNVWISLLKNLQ